MRPLHFSLVFAVGFILLFKIPCKEGRGVCQRTGAHQRFVVGEPVFLIAFSFKRYKDFKVDAVARFCVYVCVFIKPHTFKKQTRPGELRNIALPDPQPY